MTRTRQLLLAAAVVVTLALVVFVVVANGDDAPSGGVASDKPATVDVGGGVTLQAEVTEPKGVDKAPLVVMPASWGQPATQYRAIARDLAGDGYTVVAYAQRGFGGSGGQVDFAGAGSQADVSRVIDWALRTTGADPKRVGLYGMSYGAGVSLLAAAKDPRIKAVAALSTWTDIAASYDPNNTSSTRALSTLISSGTSGAERKANYGPEVRQLRTLLAKNPKAVGPRLRQLSPTRSPSTYVADLNRNRPAIMLANGFEDSLFGPQQLVGFYDKLTTPKRLQLAAGDHGGPEASSLQGTRNGVAVAAHAWLDRYLRGDKDNGIATEDPIVLSDVQTGVLQTLPTWPVASGSAALPLGAPNSKVQTGPKRATTWSVSIDTGKDTVATSGPAVGPFGIYRPPTADLFTLDKAHVFAWTGPAAGAPILLGGTPRATLNLASTRSSATVVAYLYDIDTTGTGTLMSVQPYSMTGLRAGKARRVTIDLQPIAWTLDSGHRLVLAIDTVDPRYTGLNPAGARITASATPASPASVSLPQLR